MRLLRMAVRLAKVSFWSADVAQWQSNRLVSGRLRVRLSPSAPRSSDAGRMRSRGAGVGVDPPETFVEGRAVDAARPSFFVRP